MIVLDTNVVIRIMTGEGRVGAQARHAFNEADKRYCSAMVQWELAMLVDRGRIGLNAPLGTWMERATQVLGFAEVPVNGAIAREAGSLLGNIYGDPCDRIMIATARHLGCTIMTTDSKILAYAKAGYVQAIDARR